MLLGQTTEEIRVLQTMLVNLGQLQLETGVMGRAARKLTGSFTDEQGDKLEFSWTEEQEKLYEELSGVVADNEEAA